MRRLAGSALLLLMVSVVGHARAAEPESDEVALARIKAEIVKMIGPARCRNLVHCRLLPLGLDPCGRPAEYLAYSSGFTDIPALETKASEYAFVQEELLAKQPSAPGVCEPRPEPQAACIDAHCRVVQPAQ